MPQWLTDVVRPKKAPVPWPDMIRAVFAIWVPLAAGFITGRSSLVAVPALGTLLSVMIDSGGPRTGHGCARSARRRCPAAPRGW